MIFVLAYHNATEALRAPLLCDVKTSFYSNPSNFLFLLH